MQKNKTGSFAGFRVWRLALVLTLAFGFRMPNAIAVATNWTVVGWNNLGMHCMDSEYSVFSILPPYNTINAQVVGSVGTNIWLVKTTTNCGVSYKAVADPDGSINTFSTGKSDFSANVQSLFGLSLPMDVGLPVESTSAAFVAWAPLYALLPRVPKKLFQVVPVSDDGPVRPVMPAFAYCPSSLLFGPYWTLMTVGVVVLSDHCA